MHRLEMAQRIAYIAGAHFLHQLDDGATFGLAVVEPHGLDRIDLEGRVFIAVADGRVIPQLSPAPAFPFRLVALAGAIVGNRMHLAWAMSIEEPLLWPL